MTDQNPEPQWRPHDHLDRVRRRGHQLRQRRRTLIAALTLAFCLTAASSLAALTHSDHSTEHLTVASPPGTTSTTTLSTTTSEPTPTTSPDVSTTAAPTTRATPPTSETTSTTTIPTCDPSDLARSTRSDKPSYAVGENVTISAATMNVSGHTCAVPGHCGNGGGGLTIQDDHGTTVAWYSPVAAGACPSGPLSPTYYKPGEPVADGRWDWGQEYQLWCPANDPGTDPTTTTSQPCKTGQVPPGTYTATPNGYSTSESAIFTIRR